MAQAPANPGRDCRLCPRLAAFRAGNRVREPAWFNAPVPGFGAPSARLLVVGLAPGLKGANRTGRPFTGDYAGDLLYATMKKFGFAEGNYGERPDDGLRLKDAFITNAVRCVPPENKPLPAEVSTCRQFLAAQIAALPGLKIILALGAVAHGSVLKVFGVKAAGEKFAHGACHALPGGLALVDSYHCSRYNTSTKRLSPAMFEAVFESVRKTLS
ncbi:MAG TPA: uracil-DNA glycosylase [Sphingomonadales bacterium]|nr:uracil-DNA glycosylase [Sphingomonadales bacterium]